MAWQIVEYQLVQKYPPEEDKKKLETTVLWFNARHKEFGRLYEVEWVD